MFGAIMYSIVFAVAGTWYGVQGVMEPGVPSLKLRFMFENYEFYRVSFWLALVVGIAVELAYQWLGSPRAQIYHGATVKLRSRGSQETESRPTKNKRRKRPGK